MRLTVTGNFLDWAAAMFSLIGCWVSLISLETPKSPLRRTLMQHCQWHPVTLASVCPLYFSSRRARRAGPLGLSWAAADLSLVRPDISPQYFPPMTIDEPQKNSKSPM
jgi:hypothetical protein